MEFSFLGESLENVQKVTPLIHNITNYVTVNDCANALLAIGGSPIMSDEPADVADIVSICGGLNINIGTLNQRGVEAMFTAGLRAAEFNRPIVLDPVGAGASSLRTKTAADLLDKLPISLIRANMSEAKALAGMAASTRGVDVCPDDVVTDKNLAASACFARDLSAKTGAVVAITGAIDIVANVDCAFAVRNGSPLMGCITGAGCMLSSVCAAFLVANPGAPLEATVSAVSAMGLAGQVAESRMGHLDGNASFRTYLIDALYRLDVNQLIAGAHVEMLS